MRKIKNYEEFTNEEINWKQALGTAALATSLATSSLGQKTDDISPVKKDTIEIVKSDSLNYTKTNYSNVESMAKQNGVSINFEDEELSKLNNMEVSYTLAYSMGITSDKYPGGLNDKGSQMPMGALLGMHFGKFSVFIDWKFFGSKDEYNVKEWSNGTVLNQFTSVWEPYEGSMQYGTYTSYESGQILRTGSCEQNKELLSLSLGGQIYRHKSENASEDVTIRGYIGLGALSKYKLTYNEIESYWERYTRWNLIDDYSYDSGSSYDYQLVKKEISTQISVNGGINMDIGSFNMGIGFNTNPGGLNLSIGYTIK